MKRFLAAIAVALLCAPVFAVVPADVDYNARPWERPAWPTYPGPVATPPITAPPSCGNPQGNVFQTAYSGMYSNPFGSEVDLWIAGNDLVATVRLANGRWLEGAAFIPQGAREMNVVLRAPGGQSSGVLTLCASHIQQSFCSRFSGALIIDGQGYSSLSVYTRNRTPANNPICVP